MARSRIAQKRPTARAESDFRPPTSSDRVVAVGRQGFIDRIVDGLVEGWAVDRSGEAAILFVFIDGQPVANCVCGLDRADLADAGLPTRFSGFTYRIPRRFLDGRQHEIAVRFATGEFLQHIRADGARTNFANFATSARIVVEGCVDGLENGALRGWAVTHDEDSGIKLGNLDIRVIYNDKEIGLARADEHRPDVAKALGCDPNCGFKFMPPVRFRDGRRYEFHFISGRGNVELSNSPLSFEFPDRSTATHLAQLNVAVEAMATQLWRVRRDLRSLLVESALTLANYDAWARRYQRALSARSQATDCEPTPLVSIICPVYRPRLVDFEAAIHSVVRQTYSNWELILVDDNSGVPELTDLISAFCSADTRIRAIRRRKNGGISVATNQAIAAAKGLYIAFFDHDDLLANVAVEFMVREARRTAAKLLYSDEDKIDDFGRFSEPNLKPDWNYRLLLSQNYVCHLLFVEAQTLRAVGQLRTKYDGAQDHDLILRIAEKVAPAEIHHVAEVLYHWRKTPGSTASAISAKSHAVDAGAAAIQDHLRRRGANVAVCPLLGVTTYAINWRVETEPTVSIIVPFRDNIEMTRACLRSVLEITDYARFEVLLVDNWSTTQEAVRFRQEATESNRVRFIDVREEFNYSRLNNRASEESKSEFLLFMNNDIIVDNRDWLTQLIGEALADPKIAAVGAKLVYPDRTVQHGGVILGVNGVGDHAYRGLSEDDPGFMGRAISAQELSAVTGALMLCRSEAFKSVGGFDEIDLAVAYNDVDLCLRFQEHGYRVVWTPAVVVEHHESASRASDTSNVNLTRFIFEERTMLERWGETIRRDRFYNRHFSAHSGIFSDLAPESLRL